MNKSRITISWKPGDIVFVLDRLQVPGNTRPLKLRFNPSPYVVVRSLHNTSLIKRLSDSFVALYANDHLKKYDGADPLFSTLPPEISHILLYDFKDFLSSDFTTFAKFDEMKIPDGIQLFDPVEDDIINTADNIKLATTQDDDVEIDKTENHDENIMDPKIYENIPHDRPYENDVSLGDLNKIKTNLNHRHPLVADDIARLYDEDPPNQEDDDPPPPPPIVTPPKNPNDDDDESDEEKLDGKRYNFRKNPKRKVWFDTSAFLQAW